MSFKPVPIARLEQQIVEMMISEDCTLVGAMDIIFMLCDVDTDSVYDIVDFLEERLPDLDTVSYFMEIYSGNEPDVDLKLDRKHENP